VLVVQAPDLVLRVHPLLRHVLQLAIQLKVTLTHLPIVL
jgi:hypothetical protein